MILDDFGVTGEHRHIINGHVPVKTLKGETPIKANGKLLVIDGGFSKAYQPETGIAGYTLTFHSRGLDRSAPAVPLNTGGHRAWRRHPQFNTNRRNELKTNACQRHRQGT